MCVSFKADALLSPKFDLKSKSLWIFDYFEICSGLTLFFTYIPEIDSPSGVGLGPEGTSANWGLRSTLSSNSGIFKPALAQFTSERIFLQNSLLFKQANTLSVLILWMRDFWAWPVIQALNHGVKEQQ